MRRRGGLRKLWRYVGAYGDELLICAARVQVGPVGQTFWAIVDRESGALHERTRLRVPGTRGEVRHTSPTGEAWILGQSGSESITRIEAPGVSASLRFSGGRWAESVCPNGEGAYVWTRKRCDVPVQCEVRIGERLIEMVGRGVEDESAGYHPRHTVWSWSAGAGRTRDGRSVGWNLVSGINDPPQRSERAIWVDGEPFEPGPVSFDALRGIDFDDGSRLDFEAEAERRRSENLLLVRYSYRQPFGRFRGALAGGLELERGLGVIEHHDALW